MLKSLTMLMLLCEAKAVQVVQLLKSSVIKADLNVYFLKAPWTARATINVFTKLSWNSISYHCNLTECRQTSHKVNIKVNGIVVC